MKSDRRALALWDDWCTATGRNPESPTETALATFQAAVPDARADLIPEAVRRRNRASTRASRDPWIAAEPRWAPLSAALAQCPTHGWPHAVPGRRDAFLLVLVRVLRMSRGHATTLRGLSLPRLHDRLSDDPVDGVCTRCVATRWLEVVATQALWSRASVRRQVWSPRSGEEWRQVGSARPCDGSCANWATLAGRIPAHAILAPAIDKHGWWADWRPMSTRALTTVLARRCDPSAPMPQRPVGRDGAVERPEPAPLFDGTTLDRLDAAVAAAEETNSRIEAWLDEFEAHGLLPRHTDRST